MKDRLMQFPIVTQRGAFLELLRNNEHGLASQLAVVLGHNPDALNDVWHSIGGDISALKAAVLDGAKKSSSIGLSVPELQSKIANGTLTVNDVNSFTQDPAVQKPLIQIIINNCAKKGPSNMAPCMRDHGIDVPHTTFIQHLGEAASAIVKVVAPVASIAASLITGIGSGVSAIINKISSGASTTAAVSAMVSPKPVPSVIQQLPVDNSGVNPQPPALPQQYYGPVPQQYLTQPPAVQGSFFSPIGFMLKSFLLISLYHLPPTISNLLGTIAFSAPLIYIGYKNLKSTLWQI